MTFQTRSLGNARFPSPLLGRQGVRFLRPDERVLTSTDLAQLQRSRCGEGEPQSFERAGPRPQLYFDPAHTGFGVVTCGGLCPGLNDVIRSLVMNAHYGYGVKRVFGFRYGYAGIAAPEELPPLDLTPAAVEQIHRLGGTILGSSRGPQEPARMVEVLERFGINVLFTIGGDGTLRGAQALVEEIARRKLDIAVIGVPKTIDNDLLWVERSFGFATAVEAARQVIVCGHTEAEAARGGVVLVKLMGRHSGFLSAHACLANNEANLCLVPEVPFSLEGEEGVYAAVEARLRGRDHIVIVVAEGAGQELVDGGEERDPSGNARLGDIGVFLRDRMGAEMKRRGLTVNVRYIDPSYILRSLPANALDAEFCLQLGEHAVHTAMAGKTAAMIGYWNQAFTAVPFEEATRCRRTIDPCGSLWQSVIAATGQMVARVPLGVSCQV